MNVTNEDEDEKGDEDGEEKENGFLVRELSCFRVLTPLLTLAMFAFTSLFRPFAATVAQVSAVRFASKTHRATYKRWRKTATGFKRGLQGRKHGNAGFSQRVLRGRTGTAYSTHTQSKILQRLLPNM